MILLQSCVVYKQTSLEKAVNSEKKVIIITKTDEILKFQRIGFEDENFYGIKKVKGEWFRFGLPAKEYIAKYRGSEDFKEIGILPPSLTEIHIDDT